MPIHLHLDDSFNAILISIASITSSHECAMQHDDREGAGACRSTSTENKISGHRSIIKCPSNYGMIKTSDAVRSFVPAPCLMFQISNCDVILHRYHCLLWRGLDLGEIPRISTRCPANACTLSERKEVDGRVAFSSPEKDDPGFPRYWGKQPRPVLARLPRARPRDLPSSNDRAPSVPCREFSGDLLW